MEYLFNKEQLKTLIANSGDSNVVAVSIDFICDQPNGVYKANIFANAGTLDDATGIRTFNESAGSVSGCPNPPGCPKAAHLTIMKSMNII